MESQFYNMSRGEFIRRVYGQDRFDLPSIELPIKLLMERITGTELVRSDRDHRIGDEFHAIYFISPQAVAVRFDADIAIKIAGIGATDTSLNETVRRLEEAFNRI